MPRFRARLLILPFHTAWLQCWFISWQSIHFQRPCHVSRCICTYARLRTLSAVLPWPSTSWSLQSPDILGIGVVTMPPALPGREVAHRQSAQVRLDGGIAHKLRCPLCPLCPLPAASHRDAGLRGSGGSDERAHPETPLACLSHQTQLWRLPSPADAASNSSSVASFVPSCIEDSYLW